MSDIAIKVENVSKRYVIGEKASYLTLRDKLVELPRRIFKGPAKTKAFWALKNVSFEVKKGEVLGIIGRNGAGKSTLLKILARITEPTSGRITMHGRVASMLEVGTGFNPELTGRENIYLNGAIIGMKKEEIAQKFDEIVAFAGVDKFLDTPVKHYSSGMYVRLAFAVAAHLDSDVLLVDEVLAVGDTEFQRKCMGKMNSLAGFGNTIILVSHNIDIIKKMCEKVLYLDGVMASHFGSVEKIVKLYLSNHKENLRNNGKWVINNSSHLHPGTGVSITELEVRNDDNKTTNHIQLGEDFTVIIYANATKNHSDIKIGFSLYTQEGFLIGNSYNFESSSHITNMVKGKNIWKFKVKNKLKVGGYCFGINILKGNPYIPLSIEPLDNIGSNYSFKVINDQKSNLTYTSLSAGVTTIDLDWSD